ncbi:staphylopine family metallophore export MFS transporter CntE [Cohnella sp. GCM10020058]|uniref:staphylopine family metallophore export MFS transporter CntE n=1 Tax=Cohnella sp. GCM10020058 TaxID=3317330 RepID=UPI00363FB0A7
MTGNTALTAPFLRLYALALLFFSANAVLGVIIPLRSASLGASNSHVGVIMGAYMFACMLFRPWAGHLIQRHGPVIVLRILLIVNGLALVLYSFVGLEGFIFARIMQGICTAFFSMALQTGIIDALPEDQRAQGVSLYSLFTYMPTVAGPLLAIGIWDWGGMHAFTVVTVAIALVTGWFGYSVPMQRIHPQEGEQLKQKGLSGALSQIPGQRPLLVCSVLMLAVSVVFGTVATFIPLYAKQVSYGHAGLYLMVQASVIVVCRLVYRKRIPSDGRWHIRFIGAVCLFAAAGTLMLSFSRSGGPVLFYTAAVWIGIAQALLYPTLMSYLTFVLPSASRNIMIGWFIAAADLGVAMGGVAMGPLADRFSYSFMYAVSAGLAALATGIVLLNRRRS